MSKRHELQRRIQSLREIANIVDGMSNIAMTEMRKLDRVHKLQHLAVESITRALNDVRYHFTAGPPVRNARPIFILFGSERGFCGAYNDHLIEVLKRQPNHELAPVIGIGSRLEVPLKLLRPDALCLPGAAVADEVDAVLGTLVAAVNRIRQDYFPAQLEVIHFRPEMTEAICEPILPPATDSFGANVAPLINFSSEQLLGELLEHYLFAITHACFFAALMAENQRRVQHLQEASDHLGKQLDQLFKQCNVIRQEEIIEEIEVILLSAELVSPAGIQGP